jgi:ABC-2 type transport system permease protein
MSALIRTEMLKLLVTRATWGLLALGVALGLVAVPRLLLSSGTVGATAEHSQARWSLVLTSSGVGLWPVLLLGVLAMSGEFHHRTVTSTLLLTPARFRPLAAKSITVALVGAAFAPILMAVAALVGTASGATDAFAYVPVRNLLGLMAFGALWGWFGVAIGALVRNQTVALLIPVLWLLVIEPMVNSFQLHTLVPYLPDYAAGSLGGAQEPGMLSATAAAVVLVGYGLALTAAAARRLQTADVT